jgi:hypothetical protein
MSTRRRKKPFHGKDATQDPIRDALLAVGATVQDLSRIGAGVPDLLVGYHGMNYLIEVKSPSGVKHQTGLRPTQAQWHSKWTGQVNVANSPEQALAIIGANDPDHDSHDERTYNERL